MHTDAQGMAARAAPRLAQSKTTKVVYYNYKGNEHVVATGMWT